MKKILLLSIFLGIAYNIFSQNGNVKKKTKNSHKIFSQKNKPQKRIDRTLKFNNLFIKNQYQVGSQLCWLSAVKMVIDFIDPLRKIQLEQINKNLQGCNYLLPNGCVDSLFTSESDWNVAIESTVGGDIQNLYRIQEFDHIFSSLGYYSTEDSTKLSWKEIAEQIDNQKPMIMMIQDENDNPTSSSHVIVVKGYYQRGYNKFIIVNDPWGACQGQKYSLDYNLLTSNKNKAIRLLKTISNIHKKTSSWCINAEESKSIASDINDPEEFYLMNLYSVNEDSKEFLERIEAIKECLKDTNCKINDDNIHFIDVDYVSYKKVKANKDSSDRKDIKNVCEDFESKDIVFVKEGIIVRIQKSNNEWITTQYLRNFYPNESIKDIKRYTIYSKIHQSFYRYNTAERDFLKPQYQISKLSNPDIKLEPNLKTIKNISRNIIDYSHSTVYLDSQYNNLLNTISNLQGKVEINKYNILINKMISIKKLSN